VRILIGIIAFVFIYLKLKDGLSSYYTPYFVGDVNVRLLLLVCLLCFLNWGIEAYKWKILISGIVKISWLKSLRLIFTAITIGLLTPNRVGEIPSRVLLLNRKNDLKSLITFTTFGAYAQGIVTLLFGVTGFALTLGYFLHTPFVNTGLLGSGLMLLLVVLFYFRPELIKFIGDKIPFFRDNKIFDSIGLLSFSLLLKILGISMLRYIVFFAQYYLVLEAFDITFSSYSDIFLIAVCFLLASAIPTILLSEIGVRGSVALFVFGFVSDNTVAIVLASISLWAINVAFPALIGLTGLQELRITNR